MTKISQANPNRIEQLSRMFNHARSMKVGGDILGKKALTAPRYVLDILAFELFLKGLVRAVGDTGTANQSHNYKALWLNIPRDIRSNILHRAAQRFGGHTNPDDFDEDANFFCLLDNLKNNFQKCRYPYEVNDKRTEEEVENVTQAWIAKDMELEGADINYRPFELKALTETLEDELKRRILEQTELQ